MNILVRFLKRLRFRENVEKDESLNVIDGIVNARKLYKELCVKAHPDKNLEHRKEAEELMKRIAMSRYNYAELLSLKYEVERILRK